MRLKLSPEGVGEHCVPWQEVGEGVKVPSGEAGGDGVDGDRL